MNIHELNSIFKPQRIALVGVTSNPNSVGGKVLSNIVGSGFQGVVYPVNSKLESVLGIQCYKDLESLPNKPDLAAICTPANEVPEIVCKCGELGINGVIIMSAGFKECGAEGEKLEQEIKKHMKSYPQLRVLGPNCLGIIAPKLKLNVSFAHALPKAGHIAFISQSGALCTSILDWAIEGKIGFSHFVSIGNTIDVGFAELIDYFGEDENTQAIILYIESIKDARKFMTAARAFARSKPIIAYKSGRFPESAEVAASHTGAMASEDSVYDAAFQRAGVSRVDNIGDIFHCAELLGRNKIPNGDRLAIITNAGGPGVMATDSLISQNGKLAILSEETINKLNENLPPYWSKRNPVDVLGDARSKRISKTIKIVMEDKNVDACLVILTPQAMTNPTTTAKALIEINSSTRKPILAAWMGGTRMKEGLRLMSEAGISSFITPDQAIQAFMKLVDYSRNLQILYETPKDVPLELNSERLKLHNQFVNECTNKNYIQSEIKSKKLLEIYGIANTKPIEANSAQSAVKAANMLGYPVVLKVSSDDITHKTDVGGVKLNIQNEELVKLAFQDIKSAVAKHAPDAVFKGVTVQKMFDSSNSIELILGLKKDPVFGTVIMVGMGGTSAEIFKDKSLGFPPLNERLARRMLESLKIWPMLAGYRNQKAKNIDKLIETMIRLSYIAADYPEIDELDINPLVVTHDEVIALDARVVAKPLQTLELQVPYSHLALHPYPEKYIKKITLSDGTEITLRPIKPEDEPLWLELLGRCSKESLYHRFRYMFNWKTHDVATRYCYIDYDREIAIVPELVENGKKQLLGVGRLIADINHENVEYAILIEDAWQNKELGSLLTDYCIEIASKWNINRIVAETTTSNPRMISVFKKRNFDIQIKNNDSCVYVSKNLGI